MELRTVRRGVAALATAAILGLAGASPVAAQELGWLERGMLWVAGLWGAEDAGTPAVPEVNAIWTVMDKGAGLDPNGGELPPPPPPPDGH